MPIRLIHRVDLPSRIASPQAAALGDFNGNGLPDIVVIRFEFPGGPLLPLPIYEFIPPSDPDNDPPVFADIAATLSGGAPVPMTVFGRQVLVRDVNGDGFDDLIIADHGRDVAPFPGALNPVFLSDGQGRLVDRTADFNLGPAFTHSVAVGDLDGDGQTEILFSTLNTPSPLFTVRTDGSVVSGLLPLPDLRSYTAVKMADVLGNGRDEIILGSGGFTDTAFGTDGAAPSGLLRWLLPQDTGSDGRFDFTPFPASAFSPQTITLDMAVLDLDGDGRNDVLLLDTALEPYYSGFSIRALLQQADGSFADATTRYFDTREFIAPQPGQIASGWGRWLVVEDMTGDGRPEILIGAGAPGYNSLFVAGADGVFRLSAASPRFRGDVPVLADITGDGIRNLLAFEDGRLSVYSFDRSPVVDQVLEAEPGAFSLRGGRGNDRLSVSAQETEGVRIEGGAGDDTILGGVGDDRIFSGGGKDSIHAGAGNDRIGLFAPAEPGHMWREATVFGGEGDDTVSALRGDFLLHGDDGNDVIGAGAGNSQLFGGAGDDVLRAGPGNSRLDGGTGHDTLTTEGTGAFTLIGGTGDDLIFGGTLRDIIYGGDGNDTLYGGFGNDEIRGDGDNDLIFGEAGADTLIGGTGNDTLNGGALGDMLFGGPGDDFLNGGFGFDRLNGGAGADTFFHLGVFDHGSDWIQDYNAAEGDVLQFGQPGATRAQFQINIANTPNAGAADVAEAFVIYRPTGQIIWALVDGAGQDSINIQLGGTVFDLLA
jgi:Ca2+-binding RTX toxin-like protein